MGQARHAAGVARACACVGMASCIPAYEPVVVQPDTLADQSRARKASRVGPRRRRVAVTVPTREHTCMLGYMKAPMRVQVA
jgi:hypothetical protein